MSRSLASACADFQFAARLHRREWLRVGGLGALALGLPDLLRLRAETRSNSKGTFGRAKSLILLYLHGGAAQQETWDPKPDGSSPARGEFGAIATAVPGIHISELLPRSAKLMQRLAIIRSLTHGNANHVQASLPALTGHAHPPSDEAKDDFPPSQNDFPPFGAVLNYLRRPGPLPTWVQAGPLMRRNNGTVLHGQIPGFLGPKYGPLIINQDLLPARVRVEGLSLNADVPMLRLAERKDLLEQIDHQRRQLDQLAVVRNLEDYQLRALNLLTSPATSKAFQLASEPAPIRDLYGQTQFGQCCLLARRLAEAGVPLINVHYCHTPKGSWDTHGKHFSQMKDSLCPTFDQAFAGLITDLANRGLLDQTLVLATAEFGRTPKVNSSGGRDHWPWVYSAVLAGGGVARGIAYGTSDKAAAHPTSHPHDPCDLAATLYYLLGVKEDTIIHDQLGRPYPLVIGKKIDALLDQTA